MRAGDEEKLEKTLGPRFPIRDGEAVHLDLGELQPTHHAGTISGRFFGNWAMVEGSRFNVSATIPIGLCASGASHPYARHSFIAASATPVRSRGTV